MRPALRQAVVACWRERRLAWKFALALAFSGALVSMLSWTALEPVLSPAFAMIETRTNDEQVRRIDHALHEFGDELLADTLDYAVWDDAFRYARGEAPHFEAETLSPVAYQNMGVDLVAIIRFDGKVLWSNVVDPASGAVLEDESGRFATLLSRTALFNSARATDTFGTYVRTPRGVYALQSAWIRRSDGSGPAEAFMVKGRMLHADVLTKALQVTVSVEDHVDPLVARKMERDPHKAFTRQDRAFIYNAVGLPDAEGRLVGAIEFNNARTVTRVGDRALLAAAAAMLLGFLLLAVLMGMVMDLIAVRRLRRLQSYVSSFGRGAVEPMHPTLLTGQDEIAILAGEFADLTRRLGAAEAELRQRSYHQGKADFASGLLHNVRNAVSPVIVTLEKWAHEDALPFRANLRRALAELEDPACDPARREQLNRFVTAAVTRIDVQGASRARELAEMKAAVEQIAQIVSGFNKDAGDRPSLEAIDLDRLLAHEAAQAKARVSGLLDIDLPTDLPQVLGSHVQLSQVIGNLFVNAVESMQAAMIPRMRIEVTADADPAGDRLVLRVRDFGEGADAATLAQAFARGYSTRTHKEGGIGLHWCANAVRAMEGELSLQSDGPGTGATAVLALRRAAAAQRTAA